MFLPVVLALAALVAGAASVTGASLVSAQRNRKARSLVLTDGLGMFQRLLFVNSNTFELRCLFDLRAAEYCDALR